MLAAAHGFGRMAGSWPEATLRRGGTVFTGNDGALVALDGQERPRPATPSLSPSRSSTYGLCTRIAWYRQRLEERSGEGLARPSGM
jgi:hypothetical protein